MFHNNNFPLQCTFVWMEKLYVCLLNRICYVNISQKLYENSKYRTCYTCCIVLPRSFQHWYAISSRKNVFENIDREFSPSVKESLTFVVFLFLFALFSFIEYLYDVTHMCVCVYGESLKFTHNTCTLHYVFVISVWWWSVQSHTWLYMSKQKYLHIYWIGLTLKILHIWMKIFFSIILLFI